MKNASRFYQKGIKLFFDGNRVEAVKLFEEGSNGGDNYASAMLAISLYLGQGVLPDKKRAEKLILGCLKEIASCAKAGDADAMRLQAQMYMCDPCKYDNDIAHKFLESAAQSGDKYAKLRLGEIYLGEDERFVDADEAYKYALDAYDLGVESALVVLSKSCVLRLDRDNFDKYFALAKKGNALCQCYVGECYLNGASIISPYAEKDEKKAYKYLSKAANDGEECAQILLAKMIRDGVGTKQDVYKAMTMLEKTAQTSVDAIVEIAVSYRDGLGVARLLAEARKYFRKAASYGDFYSKQEYEKLYLKTPKGKKEAETKAIIQKASEGDWKAQYQLGIKYAQGDGVKKDAQKAIECFKVGVQHGDIASLCWLCDMYYRSEYGICNYEKAFELCNKLIEHPQLSDSNRALTYGRIAYMYSNAKGVEYNLDKAVEMFKRSAEYGSSDAYFELGKLFFSDKYDCKNVERAIGLFKKGAQLDNEKCINQLAYIYFEGAQVEPDYALGVKYALASDRMGNTGCHSLLATAYWNGKGVEENWQLAKKYAESGLKAFEDDWWALGVLGDLYIRGCGVEKNVTKGFAYHLRAAKTGCVAAQYVVAQNYANGTCGQRDIDKAIYWCKEAIKNGSTQAKTLLAELKKMN